MKKERATHVLKTQSSARALVRGVGMKSPRSLSFDFKPLTSYNDL